MTADRRDPLVIETSYDNGLFDYLPSRAWALGVLLSAGNQQSRFWSIGDDGVKPLGSSRLGARCAAGLEGALACSVYDGTRTRFFRVAADTGAITGFGWLEGKFIGNGEVADGWLTGWVGSTAVAIDLLNARVLRVPPKRRPRRPARRLWRAAGRDRVRSRQLPSTEFTNSSRRPRTLSRLWCAAAQRDDWWPTYFLITAPASSATAPSVV
jgi:hypothetical protein